MELTLTISDELATRLRPVKDHLPQILELGLRELHSTAPSYEGLNGVLEALARLPSPEEVLALRPSAAMQDRVAALLEKNRSAGLAPDERQEWEKYEYVEHLVRMAKARAALKIAGK